MFALAALLCHPALGLDSTTAGDDALKAAFLNPPSESRPRVWWHWMNGNITPEGIAKDLEWMARIGIGGVQNFDAAMETPIIVDERLPYMSRAWQEAFQLAVEKSEELGLEFTIASSPGWSLTGGPWVTPGDAMKKVVWSEKLLAGGGVVREVLPQPPAVPGPFLSLRANYKHAQNAVAIPESYYKDSLVLAYPAEPGEAPKPPATLSFNGLEINAETLMDGNYATGLELPDGWDKEGVIELRYPTAVTVRSASLFIENLSTGVLLGPLRPQLEFMDQDQQWVPVSRFRPGKVPSTISFAPVTSDRFRIVLTRAARRGNLSFAPSAGFDPAGLGSVGRGPEKPPVLAELQLSNQSRVDAFELKAGFELVQDYHELEHTANAEATAVHPASVLDITPFMSGEGLLEWNVPPGTWKVLRLGYSLTGKTNSPASAEATGLEVDKYDADAVGRYLRTYLDMYRSVLGKDLLGERGLEAILTDSTEVGPSNWTPRFRERFRQLRGYDPTSWLPTLTGELIGSREESDRFLYDFRRTLADLAVSDHYGTVARVAHEYGLIVYGESLEANRDVASLGDDLEMRRHADIPMAAMWTYAEGGSPADKYVADMRGAASVAHLYGKKLVAAESLTSILAPWAHAPEDLQPMIDAEFVNGINRPVIHTSVHQPMDGRMPGLSLHVFGQFFTRHETWAEMAKPWIDYISRTSFLLQQGRYVADVAYFYGEEPPLGVLAEAHGYPGDVPTRYAYDFVPPHAVLNELFVRDGVLTTDGGAQYRVLYLGGSSKHFMTLPVLQRITELVENGATLVGLPPSLSPSLADNDSEFSNLVHKLWTEQAITPVGEGRVIASGDVEAALQLIGVPPDFSVDGDLPVQFVHRRLQDGELYYVVNNGEAVELEAAFRVSGKAPELWCAESGTFAPAPYRMRDLSTTVPLSMGKNESLFVIFREPTSRRALSLPRVSLEPLLTVEGPWQVRFQTGRGAPDQLTLDQLTPLSAFAEPSIRYFSGVTTYTGHFTLEGGGSEYRALILDLGKMGDVAEVRINGNYVGTVWRPPFRLDVSDSVKSGGNSLEIRVANLWVNRLIGDRQPDAQPVTYTTFETYLPSAPLRESGLIGPVNLFSKTLQPNNSISEETSHE